MIIDYCVWKWKAKRHVSSGLCYLSLMEYESHPDVAPLDAAALEAELEIAFPEKNVPYECSSSSFYLVLSCFGSTPDELPLWLQRYADRNGLAFFDPQSDRISRADRNAFEAYRAAQRAKMSAEKAQEDQERWQKEFPELSVKAAAGDASALVELGNRYSFGEGTAKDAIHAFDCYRRAAELGDADGMFNLAACYRRGEGTTPDAKSALQWYTRAMDAGDLFAPYEIGRMLADGDGLPVDKTAAEEHFKIALQRGHPEARKALNDLAKASDKRRS